ncbi:serine/threonine protein kinase [Verrucomicrobiota bacterium]
MKSRHNTSSFLTVEDFFQFTVTRKIAEGGMGTVYEAQQVGAEGFEKTVAIKTMLSKLTKKQFSQLFIDEAKLVANLVHENIVQIYQLGRTPAGYYIVMEYVNGISLANFISYHRILKIPIPETLAVFITSRIARGLAYAHKRRDTQGNPLDIVHRDVCPNNILITTEGLPKLADFGVAKVAKRALLGDGLIVGKLLYMAPEQAQKKHVDYRGDIFSLGAVLFELLTCRTIRDATKNTTLAHAHKLVLQDIPWDLLPESVSDDVGGILRKMLALEPKDRYQDTDTLAHALEYYIYRDGYGPTIQTLEQYLREHFGYLYVTHNSKDGKSIKDSTTVIPPPQFVKHPAATDLELP